MIHAEVAHHSAEGATVGLPAMNELRLATHLQAMFAEVGESARRLSFSG